MKIKFNQIPKEKQLEAITKLFLYETREVLQPFIKTETWPEEYSWNRAKYKKFFDFKREELIEYLKERIKLCEQHYLRSLNKRTTGPFMEENEKKFKTGTVTKCSEIQYYSEASTIYEATADFIMLEFEMVYPPPLEES